MKTESKTLSRKEQLRLIHGLYDAIAEQCPARMASNDWQDYVDTIAAGERRHRRGTPEGCTNHLSQSDAVKLFAVEFIAQARLGKVPDPKDFNHIRSEIFIACGLYNDHKDQIDAVLSRDAAKRFTEQVDYAALMNGAEAA